MTSPYRSPVVLSGLAAVGLKVNVALMCLQLLLTFTMTLTFSGLLPPVAEAWDRVERLQQALSVLIVISLVFAAVLFIRWQRQLIRNLPSLGTETGPDISWAGLGWIVPVFNLVAPYNTFREIASASAHQGRDCRPLIGAWWLTWILANISSTISGFYAASFAEQPKTFFQGTAVELTSNGLTVMAGLLALHLLRRLSRQQDDLRATLAT